MAIWAASPVDLKPLFSAPARRISFSMVSCPTLRSACRNARSSPGRPVWPLALQRVLAAFQEVVASGGQLVGLDPEFARQRLERSPRSNRSTASIFLPADHLGRDR
jgi:hypothetical protein